MPPCTNASTSSSERQPRGAEGTAPDACSPPSAVGFVPLSVVPSAPELGTVSATGLEVCRFMPHPSDFARPALGQLASPRTTTRASHGERWGLLATMTPEAPLTAQLGRT